MNKKVVFIIDNLGSGGAQKQLFLIASGLVKKGLRVSVYCYDDYGRDFYQDRLKAIGIVVKKQRNHKYLERIITLNRYLKSEAPSTVISFLYGANLLSTIVKTIGFGDYKLIVNDRTGINGPIRPKDLFRYNLYRNADEVVANSTHTALKIGERAAWLKSKTRVIWNIVEPLETRVNDNKKLSFLVAARYHPLKNHKRFLKAFIKALKTYHNSNTIELRCYGNMLGEENESYISELKEIIYKSGFQENISLLDETKEIREKILESDVCILPSLYEGCPNFAIEAMTAGKVVLLSDVCSNSDILPSKGGFLFSPTDEEDMTENILKSMKLSPSNRKEMGIVNSLRAKSMFDADEKLNEFLKLIR